MPRAGVAPPRPQAPPDWRAHFGVWASVAGLAFIALALAGLRGSPPAPVPASDALDPAASLAWSVLAPMAAGFPLGDPRAHLRLLSCAAAAATLALLLWRATDREQLRSDRAVTASEVVATGFGVLAIALSRSFFGAATSGGPLAAGALVTCGLLALVERSLRAPADTRAGAGLAAIAGAAAAGPMTAAALGWPLAVLAVWRALRRRARWPGPATMLFAITTLVALGLVLRATGWSRAGDLAGHLFLVPVIRGLAHLSTPALARAAAELVDQIGVVGILVAASGVTRLRPSAVFFAIWPLAGGLVLAAAEGPAAGESVGMLVALCALALPIGAGTARLAERLGRAALPATAAIGVIVSTWPLLAR